jgi:hypothetical protein
MLLDALAVLGLLAKEGARYRLTPTASEHLVPGKPMYMGDVRGIFASDVFWTALPRGAEAVKKGGTILDKHAETPRNPFWEAFAQSSASMAFPASMAIDAFLGPWIESKPRVERDDLPVATTDPAHRRGTREPERREQGRISRANDLLLDAMVIAAPRAMGHPTMQTTVEPISIG